MDGLSNELNELFVDTFRTILKVEESMLKNSSGHNLSISEMHMLEAIGKNGQAKTISDIAQLLGITTPSVTVSVSKLEKRGLTTKNKADKDGRCVLVSLTPLGERIDRLHMKFHNRMIKYVTQEMEEAEKMALLSGARKLNSFFRNKFAILED